jgi:hypothetical protein
MWGKPEFLTLTRQNHDEFLREVPLEKLSRTFQDAIFITPELGFRYLWVDSLAIVQNVPEDWKEESTRMAKIYKNAFCNLCASMPVSGRSGLLSDSRTPKPLPPVVHFNGTSGSKDWMLLETIPWTLLRATPLYRRAWVLQEQTLVRTYNIPHSS